MKTILTYLKQESTWRGLVLMLAVAGIQLAPEQQTAIIQAGLGLAGLMIFFRNDKPQP